MEKESIPTSSTELHYNKDAHERVNNNQHLQRQRQRQGNRRIKHCAEYPQVVAAQEVHQLIKESMASSSATPTTETLQEAKPKNARRGKIYQPKYPSQRSQQRKPQQVLVPKHMLQEQRLCIGDEHKWVERQATRSKNSSGWISTQLSLEAQGYNQGNRELWLRKPEFTAYKVHPMTDLPTGGVPKRHQRTQQRRRTKRKSKPKRGQTTSGHHQTTKDRYVQTWIPKEITSQISAKEKSNLVWIKAKRTKSEAYEQYIVPNDLIKAQGYYHGQTKLWLPRALLESQAGQSKPLQVDLHQEPKPKQQWRPVTTVSDSVKCSLKHQATSRQQNKSGSQRN